MTFRHRASVTLYTATCVLAQSCVFDKQFPDPFLCALSLRSRAPLSRSYGVKLPSSFTTVLSRALGYSPHPPVSVLVRAYCAGFSRNPATPYRPQGPGRLTAPWSFGIRPLHWLRNIDLMSIDYAFRPRLRSRLTLGGMTFPRKPWIFGDRDSHPVNRYSSRHIHFHVLHLPFQDGFAATWNALLPCLAAPTASAPCLFPIIIGAGFLVQ